MSAPITETGTREKLLEVGAQAIASKSFNSCGLTEILRLAREMRGEWRKERFSRLAGN